MLLHKGGPAAGWPDRGACLQLGVSKGLHLRHKLLFWRCFWLLMLRAGLRLGCLRLGCRHIQNSSRLGLSVRASLWRAWHLLRHLKVLKGGICFDGLLCLHVVKSQMCLQQQAKQ